MKNEERSISPVAGQPHQLQQLQQQQQQQHQQQQQQQQLQQQHIQKSEPVTVNNQFMQV